MKYCICRKEKGTGRVVKEELFANLATALAVKRDLEAQLPHLFWVEDANGTYIPTEEEAIRLPASLEFA